MRSPLRPPAYMVYWPQNKVSPSRPSTTNHPPLPLPHPGFPFLPSHPPTSRTHTMTLETASLPHSCAACTSSSPTASQFPFPTPTSRFPLNSASNPRSNCKSGEETEIDRARAAEHRRTSAGSVGGERQLHNCHISDPLVSGQLPPRRVSVYNGPVRAKSNAGHVCRANHAIGWPAQGVLSRHAPGKVGSAQTGRGVKVWRRRFSLPTMSSR